LSNSSLLCNTFCLLGSSNKLGHPLTTPSIKGYSSLGISVATEVIKPFFAILVADELRLNVKSPTPVVGF
jgi:hypothetical protein